jgi:hypothetical protein
MYEVDPIHEIEKILKGMHDGAGKYTKPVLKRYPLIFAFLLTFSVVAISHGFELVSDEVPLFVNHPSVLILMGVATLFLTGTLYKLLEKDRQK